MKPVNSQFAYLAAVHEATQRAETWLDLGCGYQFVPEWVGPRADVLPPTGCRVIGIDMDGDAIRTHPKLRLRIIGTVEQIPVASGAVDLVTANMVIEHVENPPALFQEVARVLRPGGQFIVHTPNLSGYTTKLTRLIPGGLRPTIARLLQGRRSDDVYPTWYRANTTRELSNLAERSDLLVTSAATIESSAQLYRLPMIGAVEEWWLRFIRRSGWAQWRPVILMQFAKPAVAASRRTA
jgi:2-polyprenyl-3-methyl-5-hydroxy-6-metoxy-1,4-benzoquinol methylase